MNFLNEFISLISLLTFGKKNDWTISKRNDFKYKITN